MMQRFTILLAASALPAPRESCLTHLPPSMHALSPNRLVACPTSDAPVAAPPPITRSCSAVPISPANGVPNVIVALGLLGIG